MKKIILMMVAFLPLVACSQKLPSAIKNKYSGTAVTTNKDRITYKEISGADKVIYSFNSGALPPEYQWSCTVILTPSGSTVKAEKLDGSQVDASGSMTRDEFGALLKGIAALDIVKQGNDNAFLCGAGVNSLTIMRGATTIYTGDQDADFTVSRGSLHDLIKNALRDEGVKSIFGNPEGALDNLPAIGVSDFEL